MILSTQSRGRISREKEEEREEERPPEKIRGKRTRRIKKKYFRKGARSTVQRRSS